MVFYDIENGKELKRINNAHSNYIYTIKYYDYSRYDMILSSSQSDIKIWNYNLGINALQSPIQNIFYYSGSYYPVFSSCVIFNKDNFHIFGVTQSYPECIRSYNSNSSQYKNIGSNDSYKCYIDSCEIDEKKYLIVGGNKGIQVFNYPDLNQYHCFIDGNDSQYHYYAKIVETKKGYNLIDIGNCNYIKIWDFNNKKIISKINSDSNSNLRGFVVINNKYLLAGSCEGNNNIKEFNIENNSFVRSFNKHTSSVVGLKPIKDKNVKNYIVSYGQDKNIFLWDFK